MRVTQQVRIAGRVQGVGYRDALRRESIARGVAGWVRNRRDGTVEAVLQGNAEAVAAVVAWAQRGPTAARVDSVGAEAPQEEFDRPYEGFEQLPSA